MTHEEFQKRYHYNPDSDRLGEGGFGEVFKAYDTYRDRWVAIKMSKVKPELESVRLKKEVELVNSLPAHPNIAFYEDCYSFKNFSGEYDFGILQFYESGNLLQLTQQKKPSTSEQEMKQAALVMKPSCRLIPNNSRKTCGYPALNGFRPLQTSINAAACSGQKNDSGSCPNFNRRRPRHFWQAGGHLSIRDLYSV